MTTVAPVSTFAPSMLAPTLGWLVERALLDDDARAAVSAIAPSALAGGAADPTLVAQALLAAGRAADAIRFVACALPPREGVWWAWVSARHAAQVAAAGGKPTPPAVTEALNAVERWISQPNDDTRRGAWVAGGVA